MSVAAMAWAWKLEIESHAKIVLLALADHADDQGVCWPGISGLAVKCSLSKRSVQRHVDALVEQGFVAKENRQQDKKGLISNLYTLQLTTTCRPPSDRLTIGASDNLTPPSSQSDTTPIVTRVTTPIAKLTPESSNLNLHPESSGEKRESGKPDHGGGVVGQGEELLTFLNKGARRNFPARNPKGKLTANVLLITSLLREGWKPEQIRQVIRLKCWQWGGNPKDAAFLRPSTLFRPSNFAGYVGEIADHDQAARAEQARGRSAGVPAVVASETKHSRSEGAASKTPRNDGQMASVGAVLATVTERFIPSEADKEALRNAAGTLTVQTSAKAAV